MYSTPTRLDPIWVARRMRCPSPPASVPAGRSRVRYVVARGLLELPPGGGGGDGGPRGAPRRRRPKGGGVGPAPGRGRPLLGGAGGLGPRAWGTPLVVGADPAALGARPVGAVERE